MPCRPPRCTVCCRTGVPARGGYCAGCRELHRAIAAALRPAPRPSATGWRGKRAVVVRD